MQLLEDLKKELKKSFCIKMLNLLNRAGWNYATDNLIFLLSLSQYLLSKRIKMIKTDFRRLKESTKEKKYREI